MLSHYTFFTVTAKQIAQLQGVSERTAQRECRRMRDAFDLAPGQSLMLRHVAQQWEVPVEELAKLLYFQKVK